MVQNLVEPLNEDVIKVTIKDKPGPRKLQPEQQLRAAFDILKLYALQERRVRQIRKHLEERGSRRRLHRCLETWRELAAAARKPVRPSSEAKIELLVNAIASKQRELQQAGEAPQKPTSSPRPESGSKGFQAPKVEQMRAKAALREQKAKLAEQRRQQLQEAKMRELDRAAKQSAKRTMEVARRALEQCDQRTRRGIIHLMRKQGCRDQSVIEIPRIPSPPRFLMRMEARSEARKERIKQTDEIQRRRREEQKKRDEMARVRTEEEQRQQQIKAQKEAIKARREQELKRLKEIEKTKKIEELADQCYNKHLFRRYILEPLSGIVKEKRQVLEMAQKHYEDTLVAKIFTAWKNEWTEQLRAKLQLADKLHRHNLLWYNFDEWKWLALCAKQKHQVAVDFYDMNLQKKSFRKWHLLCIKIKVVAHEQEVKAKKHYEKHLKKLCFSIWKRYMTIASEVNKSEQRRDEWRDLIKKFIPETPLMKKKLGYYM